MAHQEELEKAKYRNWVRGGLAYKYLKQGIEGFADDVVLQEHNRILQNIQHTPGQTCNQCSFGSFRPKHARTGTNKCTRGLKNCSCLNPKKKPCPNNVCDAIMEEILDCHDSHGSQPPTPNWRNADIQKWCSDPWEVAKCFIHSPGYSDKSKASDIDTAGLLHVFINNIGLHVHLSCTIDGSGTDVFSKTLRRRNTIFHSATMELEDNEVNESIDDMVAILEDEKELKQRPEAQQAVEKLNQLKHGSFLITTKNEVEVCRDAMVFITNKSEELKQMIQDAKDDIDQKTTEVSEAVGDKTREALENALKQLGKQNDNQLQAMKQTIQLLCERLKNVETDNSAVKSDMCSFQQRLTKIENGVDKLDTTKNAHKKQLAYVKRKQALQNSLVERYEKGYFKTWISPLRTQDNDIDVNEIYVTPNMEVERKPNRTASTSTSSEPGTQQNCSENQNSDGNRRQAPHVESQFQTIDRYRGIFHTDNQTNKKIYIVGDVGTGKSTLSKMMIYNWCRAVRSDCKSAESRSESQAADHETIQVDNLKEMSKFEFLFTIPLQIMSGFSADIKEMVKVLYKDVIGDEFVDEIFNQESERCLIIADGLDEWTPPKYPRPQHISYGIPVGDGVKNTTLVTLSRPSARGVLNMKLTEYDKKIKLLGVCKVSLDDFFEKYMKKLNKVKEKNDFKSKIEEAKLEHLEKTPLILQQLIWMFCTGIDIGKSVSDIYCNILNIMFGWSEGKEEEDMPQATLNIDRDFQQTQLPDLLRRFPRCVDNRRLLLLLSQNAFKALTEDALYTLSRSVLYRYGLSKDDIGALITSGILVENNCFDATIESTYLSFTHISYLEFFAAVYISSHYSKQNPEHEQMPRQESTTILEELFRKFESAKDILQLSNLLKMVCGLSPFLLKEISDLMSNKVMNDESMIRYRNSHLQNDVSNLRVARQIQDLILGCISECRTVAQPDVRLCDVILYEKQSVLPEEQNIVSSSVLSLYLGTSWHHSEMTLPPVNMRDPAYMYMYQNMPKVCWYKYVPLIAKFPHLQFIKIKNIRSCEICEQLSSSLGEVVFLKQLTLENIICDRCHPHADFFQMFGPNNKHWETLYMSKGHIIDLPKQDHLQSICMVCCSLFFGSIVNTKNPQSVYILTCTLSRTANGMHGHLSSNRYFSPWITCFAGPSNYCHQPSLQNFSPRLAPLKDPSNYCHHPSLQKFSPRLAPFKRPSNYAHQPSLQSVRLDCCSFLLDSVVNDGDSVVNDGDSVVNDGESVVNDGESVVNDGKSVVNDGDSVVNDGESVVNDGDSVVNDGESVVNDGESVVNDGESVVNDGESVVNDGESVVNDGDSVVNDGDSVVNDEKSVVNDGDSVVNDGDPVVNDGDSMENDEKSVVNDERLGNIFTAQNCKAAYISCERLVHSLRDAVPRQFVFYLAGLGIMCKKECEGHAIDLSKQDKLETNILKQYESIISEQCNSIILEMQSSPFLWGDRVVETIFIMPVGKKQESTNEVKQKMQVWESSLLTSGHFSMMAPNFQM